MIYRADLSAMFLSCDPLRLQAMVAEHATWVDVDARQSLPWAPGAQITVNGHVHPGDLLGEPVV